MTYTSLVKVKQIEVRDQRGGAAPPYFVFLAVYCLIITIRRIHDAKVTSSL